MAEIVVNKSEQNCLISQLASSIKSCVWERDKEREKEREREREKKNIQGFSQETNGLLPPANALFSDAIFGKDAYMLEGLFKFWLKCTLR